MPRLSADASHRIRLKLNGRMVEADAEPRMLLTDFLRYNLAMTGTMSVRARGVRRLYDRN